MADSDKAKNPAARPTVKGAGAPGVNGSTPAGSGKAPAADETAVRPAAGGKPPKQAPPASRSGPAARSTPPQPGRNAPAAKRTTPGGPSGPAKPTRPAKGSESRAEQTTVAQAPVTERVPQAGEGGAFGSGSTEPSAMGRSSSGSTRRLRRARLRLTRIDPLSVMKASFLLSVAFGVVTFVAVLITWSVLGAAGVWDSVNDTVGTIVSSGENESNFDIRDYVGMGRVLGLTLIVAVVDVILLTAIATLTAFLYNMAASLLGGVEVTLAEDEH